jgi:transposase-like protein
MSEKKAKAKKQTKKIEAYFCPKCKSKSVRNILGFSYGARVPGVHARYRCDDCGYENNIFPIMINEGNEEDDS